MNQPALAKAEGEAAAWSRLRWLPPVAALLCTAASWIIRLRLGTLKVYHLYPEPWVGTAVTGLFLLALGLGGYFLHRVVVVSTGPAPEPRAVRRLGWVTCLAVAPMLPLFSNDVFSVLAYGDLVVQGLDPYAVPVPLAASRFFPWVAAGWSDAPCVYGPLTVYLAAAAAWGSGGHLLAGFALFKLIGVGFGLLYVELAYRYVRAHPEQADGRTLALVVLTPAYWLQGPGQLHNDLFAGCCLLVALLALTRDRWLLAAGSVAAALLNKLSAGFAVALLLVRLWTSRGAASDSDRRAALWRWLLRLAGMALVGSGLAVVLYAPLWQGLATLTGPLTFLADKQPGNSLSMLLGELLARPFLALFDFPGDPAFRLAGQWWLWPWINRGLLLVAALLALRVLWPLRSEPASLTRVVRASGRLAVLAVTLVSSVFLPWYLLVVLPFFLQRDTPAWTRWLVWVGVVSSAINLPQIAAPGSFPVRVLDPLFTYGLILLFLYRLPARMRDEVDR